MVTVQFSRWVSLGIMGLAWLLGGSFAKAQVPERFQELEPFLDANSAFVAIYQPVKVDKTRLKEWSKEAGMPQGMSAEDVLRAGALSQLGVQRLYVVSELTHLAGGVVVMIVPTSKPNEVVALFPKGEWKHQIAEGFVFLSASDDAIADVRRKSGVPSPNLCRGLSKVTADQGCALSWMVGGSAEPLAVPLFGSNREIRLLKPLIECVPQAEYLVVNGSIPFPMQIECKFPNNELAMESQKRLQQKTSQAPSKLDFQLSESSVVLSLPVWKDLLALLEAVSNVGIDQMEGANNLKQLLLAIHQYHDAHGTFPPQAIADKSGKKLLSWRVLLLPYMGEDKLFREFRLDEPWDSDHNRPLIDRMPRIFMSPRRTMEKGSTCYVAPLTSKSIFGSSKGPCKFAEVTDGTSSTILLMECRMENAVVWTKPEDVVIDKEDPLKPFRTARTNWFWAGMADGAVWKIKVPVPASMFLQAIEMNDGQTFDWQELMSRP